MNKQAEREERDFDTVLQGDLRPAGNGRDCFYCGEKLGDKHAPDCVIRWGAGQYFVALRHNPTGNIRVYREDSIWNDTAQFLWTEGNFACDCNRHMMFKRAAGEEITKDDWEYPCNGNDYTAIHADTDDGRVELEEVILNG
jgi:hypothetical protein